MINALTIVTLVNDWKLYALSKASLEHQRNGVSVDFIPVDADQRGWNASEGLNCGLELARTEWVVLSHQDVLFPDHWVSGFWNELELLGRAVAVVGLVGCTKSGRFVGHVRDPHGHSRWGPLPSRVVSVDEHLIAVNKKHGLRFDAGNPGFHCYGSDLCLTALKKGLTAVVVDAPVVHLSGGRIDSGFDTSAQWLLNKWGRELGHTIPTPALIIHEKKCFNLWRYLRVRVNRRWSGRKSLCECDCRATHCTTLREGVKGADRGLGTWNVRE